MTTAAAAAIEGLWSGGGRQESSTSTGDLLCPLYVDSRQSLKRLKCANSGHTPAACRTGQIDPLLPFEIDPVNGREAPESGLRLKAAPGAAVPETRRTPYPSVTRRFCLHRPRSGILQHGSEPFLQPA
jgi:hypothetical protein